jgi:hypothetical protein
LAADTHFKTLGYWNRHIPIRFFTELPFAPSEPRVQNVTHTFIFFRLAQQRKDIWQLLHVWIREIELNANVVEI